MCLDDYRDNFNAKLLITKLRYDKELLDELISKTLFLIGNPRNSERMFCWFHNITEQPVCKHCGSPLTFMKFNKGYTPTCGSKECIAKSISYSNKYNHNYNEIQKKMKKTYAASHNGIEHNMLNPEFVKTFMDKKCKNTIKRYLDNNDYSIINIDGDYYDIKCNKCNSIYKHIYKELIPYNLWRKKQFCTNCYNNKSYTVRSKFEDSVYQYILSITNNENIITNRKIGEQYYIYDIVLYDRKLVIECNGIYYHSDACISNINYHYNKMKNANEGGYGLLQIWQDDWLFNNEYIKLKIQLIINPKYISINNCKIKCNNIYYNNELILNIIVNNENILLEYKTVYIISDIYNYLKETYNNYYIEHNLDYPLFDFEKQLTIYKHIDEIYYLYKHKRNIEYIENKPKIYTVGKITLQI